MEISMLQILTKMKGKELVMTKKTVFFSFFILCFFTITATYAKDSTVAVDGNNGAGLPLGKSILTKENPDPVEQLQDPKNISKRKGNGSAAELTYGDLLQPDIMYDVPLSTTEPNRISAEEDIIKVKYDRSIKNLAIEKEGADAFIIYKGKKDFLAYVITESAVYHVRFVPSKIPSTYYVLGEKSVSEKTSAGPASSRPVLKGNSLEARLTEMVKYAYRNEPLGEGDVTVKPLDHIIKTKELEFYSYKTYQFKEDNIFVKVLLVRTRKDYVDDTVAVREKDFLIPELLKYPVAIAVENHSIAKNEFTRVFLVGADYQMGANI